VDIKYNHVFIIGIDGAGNAVKDAYTPHIDALLINGAYTYEAQAAFPPISSECWGALFHGVPPEKHQLNNDNVIKQHYPEDSSFPSFMKLARKKWPDCHLASFSSWEPINSGIIEQSSSCRVASMKDDELAKGAAAYIRDNKDIKIMFIQFDDIDAAGHKYGFWSKEYFEKITETDAHVGLVIEAIKDAGLFNDSLIIICADHGGGAVDVKDHGSNHPLDMNIFWGCFSSNFKQGHFITDEITIMDTAAVVANAIGLDIHENWDAKVPEFFFNTHYK
jgi:predicted AlkP superfamily pyrophosphatase or phosphodiesterase